jgi:hypothetical protein
MVAATILLAYALASVVNLPKRDLQVQLPGLYLAIEFNVNTVVSLLVAALTASGADWLLRDHPMLGKKSSLQHWLVPSLTALVIGVPLSRFDFGIQWFASFVVGGSLLMIVLVAEYIVVDPGDARHALATASLTAVSFALLLVLAIALNSAGMRLFLVLPALSIASGLISLRTLHLRLPELWAFFQSIAIAIIIAQFTAALHYWPLSPITFGLVLLGPAYALTSLVGNLAEGESFRQAIIEPILVLSIVWLIAIWSR